MFELCDADGDFVGDYATLDEAREAKAMYENENPDNSYTIYKVIRVAVE